MNSIKFTCEVVTPMFLAGADGEKPELRPPSIKGAMRFWWRAMHGYYTLSQLRQEEARIFGGGGEDARRSNVVIKTTHPEWDGDFKPCLLPHKNLGSTKAFNPKIPQSFEITLSLNRLSDGFDISKLEGLFVITCVLGGLGKRSRRGFGSVKIVKRNDFDFSMPNDFESIYSHLSKFNDDYQYDRIDDKILLVRPDPLNGKYQKIYPYIEEIKIGHDYASAFELVERIGKSSHKYQTDSNGCASPRFSSPTFVSVLLKDHKYYPIITALCLSLPTPGISENHLMRQRRNDFKSAILDKTLQLD